jgi:stalled ribosome alternative rescue factor ArfA
MQNIRKNPIAASLASAHLAPRKVRARKGKGSFRRTPKHRGAAL